MLRRLGGLSRSALRRTRALLGGSADGGETAPVAGAVAAEASGEGGGEVEPGDADGARAGRDPRPGEPAPRVVARTEHPLSRRLISRSALKVLERLHEGGFRACLVGGGVRDALVGLVPKDFDVATDASPEEVRRLFRNSRIIGRRFRLVHVVFGREIIEVATFRAAHDKGEGGEIGASGRIVRDNVFGSIVDDARRRDFSVNALYYDVSDRSIVDYVGGLEDIERRVFRLIGDPVTRCAEDPVRVLRAVRLAAKLDFSIEPATLEAMREAAPELRHTPPARLFDEVLKLFQGGYAERSFAAVFEHDLLRYLFPALDRRLRAGEGAATLREMLDAALANTDRRVAEDKPVTPAYLLAFMLWPDVEELARERVASGIPVFEGLREAGERVLAAQLRVTSIPRRFSGPMKEIWQMQPRLERQRGARALALLEERRFRAAYDFLCLRARVAPALVPLAEWWTAVQELPETEREDALAARPLVAGLWGEPSGADTAADGLDGAEERGGDIAGAEEGAVDAPGRRRRRRGGRRRGGRSRRGEAESAAEGSGETDGGADRPEGASAVGEAGPDRVGPGRDEGSGSASDADGRDATAVEGTPKRPRRRRRRRPGGDRARVPGDKG